MIQTDSPLRTINSRKEIHDAKFYITFPHKSTLKDFILLTWRNKIRYHNLISVYFFGRENQINPREKFSIFGRENELRP